MADLVKIKRKTGGTVCEVAAATAEKLLATPQWEEVEAPAKRGRPPKAVAAPAATDDDE